ncbi:winged helix-turn-helix transcriptional regulator [Paenibacillus lautus]|uniref:winged helix-turn-helix transcriptional regulator n=1 Tax=Paenibacillus lautus TaxID=1401 RepID=UPI003D2B53DA
MPKYKVAKLATLYFYIIEFDSNIHFQIAKWKGIIVDILSEKSVRFNELQRLILVISQRKLTLQLRELEADGIVSRAVDDTVPPNVEKIIHDHRFLRIWGKVHYF